MLRTLCTAAVAALALAVTPAHADFSTFECTQQPAGLIVGYIAHPEGGTVSIRCFVADSSGAEVYSTPTGTGTGVAATAGAFVVTSDLDLCTEAIDVHGHWIVCQVG